MLHFPVNFPTRLPEKMPSVAILLLVLTLFSNSKADQDFDVRQHLSTVTRYGAVKDIVDNSFVPSDFPVGCTPIHLNLVARHGTRSPTKKRMRELEKLASHIQERLKDAKEKNLSLLKVPAWLLKWESPWKGKLKGGELDSKGEEELYQLGIRVRERFPDIFNEEYHPDVYPIKTTQVPRASASAVAFGMGLFSGKGSLGPGRYRAFAVTSESRASDIILRFFDCCQTYKDFRKNQEPAVDKLKEPILAEITCALAKRYEFNFTRQDISSLWFLCKQETSLLDITDQACNLFSPNEVALLEWTDDLEVFMLKGYGESLNYRMGVPLLKDVVQSMDQAIKAKEDNQAPGSYEKARLRFAHAETVVPFSCLLGLFLEGSDFQRIQREEPLGLPSKPPHKRNWRGSIVAPFAGNNMLVLYSCPTNSSSKYFMQVLHNEHPIPMPGCDGTDFCPFEVFKDRIVHPHLKHDYNTLCNVNLDQPKQKPETKLWQIVVVKHQ
ncbi:multiple inositol polyphosphate phosphatase 1-like isoform X2 [Durio zibethinus]|uniref:Multiple inositol polyphosphate phosphatase 1 n=1 Tax=Durio zibethinus TaxID=66656 RepID=A0A6P5Z6T5_DURZI|nr:multiple inositol polyphosphate phosphatase 1-like isoform X2 [Durio zibethinus]